MYLLIDVPLGLELTHVGMRRMFLVSLSCIHSQCTGEYECDGERLVCRLGSVRRELWHENAVIDILKFDLEGAEYDVLNNMLDDRDALYNVKYIMFEVCLARM